MSRPRLLDLFCKAGGAAMGYHQAGFDVVGVDIEPQPNYPFQFVQADALEFLIRHDHQFDVVHASPPCQGYSTTRSLHSNEYPRLIGATRAALVKSGRPYVIENVAGARVEMRNPVQVCGSSFGLGVRRHRLFESNLPLSPSICAHHLQPEPVDVTGTGASRVGPRLDGKGGNSRKPRNLEHARQVMGIDWMSRRELSEAIPPPYTEYVGRQLLAHLQQQEAA